MRIFLLLKPAKAINNWNNIQAALQRAKHVLFHISRFMKCLFRAETIEMRHIFNHHHTNNRQHSPKDKIHTGIKM